MANEDSAFLKEQAERCRWLASQSREPGIAVKLRNLARQYENRAASMDASASSLPSEERP